MAGAWPPLPESDDEVTSELTTVAGTGRNVASFRACCRAKNIPAARKMPEKPAKISPNSPTPIVPQPSEAAEYIRVIGHWRGPPVIQQITDCSAVDSTSQFALWRSEANHR